MQKQFTISSPDASDQFDLERYVATRYAHIAGHEAIGVEVSIFPHEVFATIVLSEIGETDWDAAKQIESEISNSDPRRPITVTVSEPSATSSYAPDEEL